MMRAIDADALNSMKFHDLPYTHIIPQGCEAKSYERGWNDAIDSIVEGEPTIEPERKKGKWIEYPDCLRYEDAYSDDQIACSACHHVFSILDNCTEEFNFCPNCGADMRGER